MTKGAVPPKKTRVQTSRTDKNYERLLSADVSDCRLAVREPSPSGIGADVE